MIKEKIISIYKENNIHTIGYTDLDKNNLSPLNKKLKQLKLKEIISFIRRT